MLIALTLYPRWVDLRRTARGDSEDMEVAASRAMIRWARRQTRTINGSDLRQTAREFGVANWTTSACNPSNQLGDVAFAGSKPGPTVNNPTPWADVTRFRTLIFEEAILSASTTLTEYQVAVNRDITEVQRRIIETRSNLAYQQTRQATALCCAGILFDRASIGTTGIFVTVGEDALGYAAALADAVALITCNAQPSRALEHNLGRPSILRRALTLVGRWWRTV